MIQTVEDLNKNEGKTLLSYAVKSKDSRGREYKEKFVKNNRTNFQIDRDRIIHAKAFRRLKDKTQVFIVSQDDHFRDRLTHSLEVAQISRDIARTFGLNEDLAESIALAHDLGHTPFGHSGEEKLNEIMLGFGSGFEHNLQSKRVVTVLEQKYPDFPGLNLSVEVIEGLIKHQTAFDNQKKKIKNSSLEAQVVNLADEIAYTSHDIDDGLRSGLLNFDELSELEFFKEAQSSVKKSQNIEVQNSRIVSQLIYLMIKDLTDYTDRQIAAKNIKTLKDVQKYKKIVSFSPRMEEKVKKIRQFLLKNLYFHKKVQEKAKKGQIIIEKLFNNYQTKQELLPVKYQQEIDKTAPLETIIKDYIAGMTDNFAIAEYNRINKT